MGEIGNIFNLIFTFPIFNGLMLLYRLFGDFALSIIVLTVVIKLLLFPLTLQQLKSTKAMQALQPQMAEIKKKYAKDQQAQLTATQALYKESGVNPASGCLPLLVQMPVLYGLYFAINSMLQHTAKTASGQLTVDVRAINSLLYPFVPHFSQAPNLNLDWFTFINPAWHISLLSPAPALAILAGIATFVQLRMSQPKPVAGATAPANDPSAQSMKMMQYVMPVMITIFGWNVAAGLALYWMVSSIFQAVQQFFVTGWGALLVAPSFNLGGNDEKSSTTNSKGSNSYTGDQRRERSLERKAKEADVYTTSDNDDNDGESNSIASRPHTSTNTGGTSQYNRRRQRPTSASARRRGSTQRSRS